MKPVKNLVFTLLLVFAITGTTSAGEVPIPPVPPTPPRATAVDTDGVILPSPVDPDAEQSGETVETSDYLLFEALKALFSLY